MTVLTALSACYDRLADSPHTDGSQAVPPFGYSMERIAFLLVIDRDGAVVDVVDQRASSGISVTPRQAPRPVPRLMAVPQSSKRSGTTPRPYFLWDNSKFVLGVGSDRAAAASAASTASAGHARFDGHQGAFAAWHRSLLAGTDDPGLTALLGFLDRWTPQAFWAPAFSMLSFADELPDLNLAFMLDGDRHDDGSPRPLHRRPAARRIWEDHLAGGTAGRQICLATGRQARVVRLHPSIKGVAGAQIAGASLVSFNRDAFVSYGKEQGANAPVSEVAAFAYATALNALLAPDSRRRLQIGDATTVFWAQAPRNGEPAARAAEELLATLLDPPGPDDDGNERLLREVAGPVRDGRPLYDLISTSGVDENIRFFLLGLAPSSARLAVRFWHESPFDRLVANIRDHWNDLRIEPTPWVGVPGVRALLYETAPMRKAENIPAQIGGALMRAVLTGSRYPRSLLAAVIVRIRADSAVNPVRAALCAAWLRRDARLTRAGNDASLCQDPAPRGQEEVPVSLNRLEPNPAYRLGRLFAVLESIQRSALGRATSTIRDGYFGTASATPASVFPLLLRNGQHHLAMLRKHISDIDSVFRFENEIDQIIDGLGTNFPRHQNLEDQGRFAVGYYHQRTAVGT
jgi:CRISPR-associated protein Csd1